MKPKNYSLLQSSASAKTSGEGGLRILQISDCHLYADANRTLAGVNTLDTFDEILALASSRYQATDLILATGDLVHDASPSGYRRVSERFGGFGIPVYCLAGNHDVPEVMTQALNGGSDAARVTAPKTARHGKWLIILLDSTIPGEAGGHLSAQEIEVLDQSLDQHPDCHALICLHHHPVPIGSAWMDSMALNNPDDFFQVIDRYPAVKGILWGHIHQVFEDVRNGVRLMGSPSTCIQFTPRLDEFGLDQIPPGLRWLELLPDGEIRSGIERLAVTPLELDLNVGGY